MYKESQSVPINCCVGVVILPSLFRNLVGRKFRWLRKRTEKTYFSCDNCQHLWKKWGFSLLLCIKRTLGHPVSIVHNEAVISNSTMYTNTKYSNRAAWHQPTRLLFNQIIGMSVSLFNISHFLNSNCVCVRLFYRQFQ